MSVESNHREPADDRPVPTPPRVVAVSGIIFSALFIASLVIVRQSVPPDPTDPGHWLSDPQRRDWVRLALNLVPFTGIVFLWYMGVLRNRIGVLEDRFFSTVFLGSGFTFVAMLFACAAMAQGVLETFASQDSAARSSEAYVLGRRVVYTLLTTFALKMAAVFMFVTSMIGFRTRVFSRWVTFVGFGIALIFLVTLSDVPWIALLFPAWVLLVSVWILLADLRQKSPQHPGRF